MFGPLKRPNIALVSANNSRILGGVSGSSGCVCPEKWYATPKHLVARGLWYVKFLGWDAHTKHETMSYMSTNFPHSWMCWKSPGERAGWFWWSFHGAHKILLLSSGITNSSTTLWRTSLSVPLLYRMTWHLITSPRVARRITGNLSMVVKSTWIPCVSRAQRTACAINLDKLVVGVRALCWVNTVFISHCPTLLRANNFVRNTANCSLSLRVICVKKVRSFGHSRQNPCEHFV